jgi:membrane protein DedA with SNARE-associated domain
MLLLGWFAAGFTPAVAAAPHVPTADELKTFSPVWQVIMIMIGTLLSEDLTCIVVGLAMRSGDISPWIGGIACFLGIYVGDLLLFLAGRMFGRGLLKFRIFSHGFGAAKLEEFGRWFERRPWAALAMCRVAPGLRMPLFLTVGALTRKTATFFWWTCFFAFVWTPILVGLVYWLGDAIVKRFEHFFGGGWRAIAGAVIVIFVAIRVITLVSTREGRLKIAARWDKLIGRKPAEQPLTEPDSPKHPPGVAPVVTPDPRLTSGPFPAAEGK